MTVCPRCEQATIDGAGQALPVAPQRVEQARCDAQEIGSTHVGTPERASQTIPPATRRLVWRRDHGRCRVEGCRSSRFLEVHHIVSRAEGGTHDPSNLMLCCGAHHAAIHAGRIRADLEEAAMRESQLAIRALGYSVVESTGAAGQSSA